MKTLALSLALGATALLTGCGSKTPATPTAPATVESPQPIEAAPTSAPAAETTAPAATAETSDAMSNATTGETATYRVRGQVVEVPAENGATVIVIKHEDIPGFMPAMEMRLPLANPADGKTVKPGDKVAFDLKKDNMKVSNIEKLPPSTALKLAP